MASPKRTASCSHAVKESPAINYAAVATTTPKRSVSYNGKPASAAAASKVSSPGGGVRKSRSATSLVFGVGGGGGPRIRTRLILFASFACYTVFFAWSARRFVGHSPSLSSQSSAATSATEKVTIEHLFRRDHEKRRRKDLPRRPNALAAPPPPARRRHRGTVHSKGGDDPTGHSVGKATMNAPDQSQQHEDKAVSRVETKQQMGSSSVTMAESSPSSPYAYCFLLGAIHETQTAYVGFMYNIMISVHILRRLGSTADFVVWTQLSSNSTLERLPDDVSTLLGRMDIKIRELPKPTADSFAQIVYEKFRPLQMTEYRRVMFLDGDLMPLVNMDYIFRISEQGAESLLRPNMIFATRGEPANAGWFVLEPREGDFEKLHGVIDRQREEGLKLPYPHFSKSRGWGHDFEKEGDFWESIRFNKTKWQFWAVHSDQGLLYYWAKYFKQDTSIVIGPKLQNWRPGPDGKPELISQTIDAFNSTSPTPIARQRGCRLGDLTMSCVAPYSNWMHFTGKSKPWQQGYSKMQRDPVGKIWFDELSELNTELAMNLDVKNFRGEESPLGYMAKWNDNAMFLRNETHHGAGGGDSQQQEKLPASSTVEIEESSSNTTIAYAVSFIKCGDFQTHSAGLVDASLVLRHSIHKNSVRNPKSGSQYDYKMYAIVHRQAEKCSGVIRRAGFEVRIVDPPVRVSEIRGDYLRKKIHREVCCGADEFVKLYAYSLLPEQIVVHVDIDFVFYKPIDHLFDAILYGKDTERGAAARRTIELERPTDKWPDKIDAFITRDWPQVVPNKFPPAFQAGFLVARRDPSVLVEVTEIIKEGNYSEGWGWKTGWGNKGYGGYVGAMAMQGVMGYFYDHIRPDSAIELNQCRYNHMGMSVQLERRVRYAEKGACRNGSPDNKCEDCRKTDVSNIYSAHYTKCRKPWQCQAVGYPGGRKPNEGRATALDTSVVNVDHCLDLQREWHKLRKDLEDRLFDLTQNEKVRDWSKGTYRPDVFMGHCNEDGNSGYVSMTGINDETFQRIQEMYQHRQPLLGAVAAQ